MGMVLDDAQLQDDLDLVTEIEDRSGFETVRGNVRLPPNSSRGPGALWGPWPFGGLSPLGA